MEKKNQIFNLLIIVFALIFAHNIHKNHTQQINSLKQKIEEEKKKKEVMVRLLEIEKRYSDLKEKINKKDVSLVMDKIRTIAKRTLIDIKSMKPSGETEDNDFKKYSFDLVVLTDSYHSLAKFISELERDQDIYIISSISISPSEEKLNCSLRIETILLK